MRANLLFILTVGLAILTMTSCRKRCGCNDDYASNFEHHVRIDDGSCVYQPRLDDLNYLVYGCEAPYHVTIFADVYPRASYAAYNFQNTITIDYGDGNRETIYDDHLHVRGITHDYAQAGSYTVMIRVANEWGIDEKLMTVIIDPDQPIQANFKIVSQEINSCLLRAKIGLRNTSIHASEYLWTFGDGTSSTQPSPQHVYTQAGNYTITLKAICGGKEAIHTANIEVTPLQAIADFDFSAEHDNYKAPALLYFDNHSTDAETYTWSINGQVISHDEHLDYKFMQGGTYDVALEVKSCSPDSDISVYKERIVIEDTPDHFSIPQATFWLPINSLLPDTYFDQYYGLELYAILKYNGNAIGSSINILDVETGSVTFTFPADLHIGSFGLSNFNYSNGNQVTLELWDANDGIGNDVKLYTFPFNTAYLQDEYYPERVEWAVDNAGYGAEISIVY